MKKAGASKIINAYWYMGKVIVQEEQQGQRRAECCYY
jgi:hypothetical protein